MQSGEQKIQRLQSVFHLYLSNVQTATFATDKFENSASIFFIAQCQQKFWHQLTLTVPVTTIDAL